MAHPRKQNSTQRIHRHMLEKPSLSLMQGRYLVPLILSCQKNSGLPLDQIRFNFCLKSATGMPYPADEKSIRQAISDFLASPEGQDLKLTKDQVNALKEISLSKDPTKLNDYTTTVEDRGKSFHAAATNIIKNSNHLSPAQKETYYQKLDTLKDAYLKKLESLPRGKEAQAYAEHAQAYFEAYIDTMTTLLKPVLPPINGKDDPLKHLENAETLCNISDRQAEFTLSGGVDQIHLQADEPRNRFCDFSHEQKREWIRVYWASLIEKEVDKAVKELERVQSQLPDDKKYSPETCEKLIKTARSNAVQQIVTQPEWMKAKQEYKFVESDLKNKENLDFKLPPWFEKFPAWEKQHWMGLMESVMKQGNEDVCMGPVVKKGGIPGLRNAALSSYATIKYSEFKGIEVIASPKTVRSSNIIAQKKEGQATLTPDESLLTESNIRQVSHLYKNTEPEAIAFPWKWSKDHKPRTLCQTLLRMKGGGDDHVITHKDKIVKRINSYNYHDSHIETSNHCIGAPGKIAFWVLSMLGSNVKGNQHLTAPIRDFIDNAVFYTAKIDERGKERIEDAFKAAQKGEFNGNLKISDKDTENTSLNRIFLALSEYVKADKEKNYEQNYQLHEAALEEIIYQYTGNRVQSSCKSGKDREGIEKTYRNALLAYFDKYGGFPPVEPGSEERKRFVAIFMELFETNHQARLAELNASGCNGLKALKSILPDDILEEAEKRGLLKPHAQNASLNEVHKAKVKRNDETYQATMNGFQSELDELEKKKTPAPEVRLPVREKPSTVREAHISLGWKKGTVSG